MKRKYTVKYVLDWYGGVPLREPVVLYARRYWSKNFLAPFVIHGVKQRFPHVKTEIVRITPEIEQKIKS